MIFNPTIYSKTVETSQEIIHVPTQSGVITYNGASQSPEWNNYDTSKMTLSGQTSETNAGTYTVTFSLIDTENTLWSDYTRTDKEITWEIQRETITTGVPSQQGFLEYTGNALTPTWKNYNPTQLEISGSTSAINSDGYIVTFTPKSNYKWDDNTTTGKQVYWYIYPADQTIYTNITSLELTPENPTATIQVYGTFFGTLRSSYGAAGAINAQDNNTSITVTAIGNGERTLRVYVDQTENYATSNIVNIPVVVSGFAPADLNDATWEDIFSYRSNGTLFNYYSIGDKKSVKLNGSIGNNFNLSNFNIDAFLVDDVGHAVFEFGKINNILTAFYNSTDFQMNNQNPITLMATNSGGWAASDMRLKILGADQPFTERKPNTFLSLIPNDLGSVISMAYNYTENSKTVQTAVTGTYDSLYLPSEFEIFGVCKYSYQEESSYQHQLKYYKLGNSKVFHEHSNLSNPVFDVWTRSRTAKTTANDTSSPTISQSFCCVHYDGTPSTQIANVSCGISVLFNI